MAYFQGNFYSKYLSYDVKVSVILPERPKEKAKKENYKVLYLLHGRGDNSDSWVLNSQILLYANEHQVAVIMPSGEDGFYTNTVEGKQYFSFMTEELPSKMKELFPISDKPEDTYIAGLSMGGYGALKIGLTYPERFAGIGIFSAAIRPDQMPDFPETELEKNVLADNLKRTFGEGALGKEDDPYELMEQCRKRQSSIPKIIQYEGKEDFLYDMNRDFKQYMERNGFNYLYEEWSGSHNWYFWNVAVKKFMKEVYV